MIHDVLLTVANLGNASWTTKMSMRIQERNVYMGFFNDDANDWVWVGGIYSPPLKFHVIRLLNRKKGEGITAGGLSG